MEKVKRAIHKFQKAEIQKLLDDKRSFNQTVEDSQAHILEANDQKLLDKFSEMELASEGAVISNFFSSLTKDPLTWSKFMPREEEWLRSMLSPTALCLISLKLLSILLCKIRSYLPHCQYLKINAKKL